MALCDPDQFMAVTLTKGELALQYLLADPLQRAAVAALLEITPLQVHNLLRLAAYLRTLPADYEQFSMGYFFNSPDSFTGAWDDFVLYDINHPCGTTACAVGHGPAAGIAVLPTERLWEDYMARAFGGDKRLAVYDALFHADWAGWDDTHRGAAARIIYALSHPTLPYLHPCADGDQPALYAQYVA